MKRAARRLLTKIFLKQAAKIINKYNPTVVAVAGSVGKTSTKLAIAKFLSEDYKVQYEKGNYNVPLSVPFVVTGQRLPSIYNIFGWFKAWLVGQKILKDGYQYEVVVLEYGIDHIGEMNQFSLLGQPDIAVITAVADEHMEFLKDIDTVAKEELSLVKFSKQTIINMDLVDQKYIAEFLEPSAIFETVGKSKLNNYLLTSQRTNLGRLKLNVKSKDGKFMVESETHMLGEHSLTALALASVVAHKLGLSVTKIEQAINNYNNPPGRMNVLDGIKDLVIIDDTYNASPVAVKAALDALYSTPAQQRIALLGNMNELGEISAEAHRQVGAHCKANKLELVVTLGKDANKYLAPEASKKGCQVVTAESPVEAARIIEQFMSPKSVVLAKGSQNGVYAEEAVKLLLKTQSKASSLLVRQSPSWLATKKAQFPDID